VTDIGTERARQRAKWGGDHGWGSGDCSAPTVADRADRTDTANLLRMAVLTEEVGEVARAVMERDRDGLRAELVQVAAVAVAWIEGIDAK
jgi:hypothetical protein